MESAPNPYTSPSSHLFGSSSQTTSEAVPSAAIVQLQRTKPWTRLIGVIAWLTVALMGLGSIAVIVAALAGLTSSSSSASEKGFMIGMAVTYLLFSFLYIYPAIKIWSYGSAIKILLQTRSEADLVKALDQQRSLWKFAGIMTIVLLSIYALFFLFAFVMGIGGALLKSGSL